MEDKEIEELERSYSDLTEMSKDIPNPNTNYQYIGIDIADENFGDLSAVSVICGRCKTVIDTYTVNQNHNEIPLTAYKKCPSCGTKFTKHLICE